MDKNWFNYDSMIQRNIGFVSEAEQNILKKSTVFIAGVGGMGGAALMCLVRAGIENFVLADFDEFEVSNFNRQLFADHDSINTNKVEATEAKMRKINPQVNIKVWGKEWSEHLDEILPDMDVVINGCDDTKATLSLMRKAQEHRKTVIDAFAAILPSVYVVRPQDPRPEKTFGYPSLGKSIDSLSEDDLKTCFSQELLYVLTNSSSIQWADLPTATQMITGERKRISFSHMVITTGCLMSYEAVKVLLKKNKNLASHKGVFFNPWTYKVERPLAYPFFVVKRYFVKKYLESMATS